MPLAPTGYEFYRNVYDFGAMGDGLTDDTIAINQAIASFSKADRTTLRCGQTCGSTTTLGALVYFPVRRSQRSACSIKITFHIASVRMLTACAERNLYCQRPYCTVSQEIQLRNWRNRRLQRFSYSSFDGQALSRRCRLMTAKVLLYPICWRSKQQACDQRKKRLQGYCPY